MGGPLNDDTPKLRFCAERVLELRLHEEFTYNFLTEFFLLYDNLPIWSPGCGINFEFCFQLLDVLQVSPPDILQLCLEECSDWRRFDAHGYVLAACVCQTKKESSFSHSCAAIRWCFFEQEARMTFLDVDIYSKGASPASAVQNYLYDRWGLSLAVFDADA